MGRNALFTVVAGALLGTAAVGALANAALKELESMDRRSKQGRDLSQARWANGVKPKPQSESQIELDDGGVADTARLRKDRAYARSCAIRGFDANGSEFRGKCWLAILDAENFITTVTSPSQHNASQSTLYYRILSEPATPVAATHIDVIKRDVSRTRMIHGHAFDTEEDADSALLNVLSAYAKHDSETGYCQGMNVVAAHLLTKMNEEQAYWTLYTLMTNKFYNLRAIYSTDLHGLQLAKYQFDKFFQKFLPQLHQHFGEQGMHADMLVEWFMTLFAAKPFPRESLDRVWDVYFVDGYKMVHRTALAILSQSAEVLMTLDAEGIHQYLKTLPDGGLFESDLLISAALSFDVHEESLDELAKSYAAEMSQRRRDNAAASR